MREILSFTFENPLLDKVSGVRCQVYLNAELGVRNVELKKEKCLIFISWSVSPIYSAIVAPKHSDS